MIFNETKQFDREVKSIYSMYSVRVNWFALGAIAESVRAKEDKFLGVDYWGNHLQNWSKNFQRQGFKKPSSHQRSLHAHTRPHRILRAGENTDRIADFQMLQTVRDRHRKVGLGGPQ